MEWLVPKMLYCQGQGCSFAKHDWSLSLVTNWLTKLRYQQMRIIRDRRYHSSFCWTIFGLVVTSVKNCSDLFARLIGYISIMYTVCSLFVNDHREWFICYSELASIVMKHDSWSTLTTSVVLLEFEDNDGALILDNSCICRFCGIVSSRLRTSTQKWARTGAQRPSYCL